VSGIRFKRLVWLIHQNYAPGTYCAATLLARIAEPLYTTKARGLGLGLALALARSILEKNRGSLHAVSRPGAGTTFTVRLTAAPRGGPDR
jgi:C4-dicarboxylate-specific signal transduction histidine kinase